MPPHICISLNADPYRWSQHVSLTKPCFCPQELEKVSLSEQEYLSVNSSGGRQEAESADGGGSATVQRWRSISVGSPDS